MGIPAVCSAVGTNCEVIEHEANGLLASTHEEWIACLERLIDDADLRKRLGEAARKTVEERFSMRASAKLFARVAREAAGRPAQAALEAEAEHQTAL
ncbi:MAG TPA: glycosyltransferase, partial [Blastocatellia bacterium]|nr:glycosyltransferase [Blastocatellia bacterium]